MTPLDVYTLTVLGNLSNFLMFFIILGFVILLILGILLGSSLLNLETNKEIDEKVTRAFIWVSSIWAIVIFLNVITPNKKTLCAMYSIPYVLQDGIRKEVPSELMQFIREYLSEYSN